MTFSVLVIEDLAYVRENSERALAEAGYLVDTAASREEALEKIRCRTYDIALVDIMLKEDVTDRGGIEVVRTISQLNEGTRMIVVSATDDINVAIRTYQAGIVGFLRKPDIKSSIDVVEAVNRAIDGIQHPLYGPFSSLNALLAAPELTPYWESMLFSTLNCGYDAWKEVAGRTFETVLPLLRLRNQSACLRFDRTTKSASGMFWSKQLGHAVWIAFANKDGDLPPPPTETASEIFSKEKGRVCAKVWRLFQVSRDEFIDTVWERP